MSEPIFLSVAIKPATTTHGGRLETILASAEEALARAEQHLRQAQAARRHNTLQQLFNTTALDRYPQFASRQ